MMDAGLAYQRARQEAAVHIIGDRADAELVRLVVFRPADSENPWPEFASNPPGQILPDTPGVVLAQEAVAENWSAIDALAAHITKGERS